MKESRKYKALVVAPSGIHLKNFLDRLDTSQTEVLVVTSTPLIFETEHAVKFVDFSLKRLQNHWQTPGQIRKYCLEFGADIVHVHQINSVAYFTLKALKGLDIPVVATAWGSDILVIPDQGFLQKALVRYTLKRATAFTSDSHFMAKRMEELVPERKLDITVCNFGVALPTYELPKEQVIYSNRLHKPLYRVDKIIEAFAAFAQTPEGASWRLVVGATGTETEALQALAKATPVSERIEFVGWLEKAQNTEWYAKAKVWASVPESDATAISLLEAISHGCYPVLSELPANREWVSDRENGWIVPDLEANFFAGISKVDFAQAAQINKKKIAEEATFAVSEEKFRALHQRLLKSKLAER